MEALLTAVRLKLFGGIKQPAVHAGLLSDHSVSMAIRSINVRLRNSAPLQMEIADEDRGKTPTWKPWIPLCSHRPWCNPRRERGRGGDPMLRLPLPVCHPAPPAQVLKRNKTNKQKKHNKKKKCDNLQAPLGTEQQEQITCLMRKRGRLERALL